MKTISRRATVYLAPELHKALRVKAMETEQSVSGLINDAVRVSLKEDGEDLASFQQRSKEPSLDFEALLKGLKRRGKLSGKD